MSSLSRALLVATFAFAGCASAPTPGPSPAPAPSAVQPAAAASASVSFPTPATSASIAAPPKDAAPPGSCDAGAVPACDELAERWTSRDFAGVDAEEARVAGRSLKAGCDAHGVSSACLAYAIMRKSGMATGKADGDGAKAYFAKLKGLGDLNGFRGEPTSPEGALAVRATTADCEGGRARACGQLGWAAYNAVQRDRSVKDAFLSYARACELGSGNGCRWAGHFAVTYPDDTGGFKRLDALLERGCGALGNAGACDEQGVEKAKRGDAKAAQALYTRACDGGSRLGCLHLGELLLARRDAKAGDLFKIACDAGEEAACKKASGK